MPDRPNLDYEPGPQDVSYSRLGPPVQPEKAAGQETAGAVANLAYEMAGELGSRPQRRRRISRRRYRYR